MLSNIAVPPYAPAAAVGCRLALADRWSAHPGRTSYPQPRCTTVPRSKASARLAPSRISGRAGRAWKPNAAGAAYTTVMTVLNRLAEQGLVARRRAGRAFAYNAVVDRAEVTARQMQRLLATGDDRVAVLRQFLGVLSDDDERALIELIGRVDNGDGAR